MDLDKQEAENRVEKGVKNKRTCSSEKKSVNTRELKEVGTKTNRLEYLHFKLYA